MYHDFCYLYKCIIVNCNKNNLKKICNSYCIVGGMWNRRQNEGVSQ